MTRILAQIAVLFVFSTFVAEASLCYQDPHSGQRDSIYLRPVSQHGAFTPEICQESRDGQYSCQPMLREIRNFTFAQLHAYAASEYRRAARATLLPTLIAIPVGIAGAWVGGEVAIRGGEWIIRTFVLPLRLLGGRNITLYGPTGIGSLTYLAGGAAGGVGGTYAAARFLDRAHIDRPGIHVREAWLAMRDGLTVETQFECAEVGSREEFQEIVAQLRYLFRHVR